MIWNNFCCCYLLEGIIRGHYCWLTLSNQELEDLYSLPHRCVFYFPSGARSLSRTQPRDSNVLLSPPGVYTRLNSVLASVYTVKRLADGWRDLLILWPHKTSLMCNFLCLLNWPPANLEGTAFFFSLSLHSLYGVRFRFYLGNSWLCKTMLLLLPKL